MTLRLLLDLWTLLAAQRQRRTQAQELRGMGERELADIGIGRSEIPALLGEARVPTSPGTSGRTGGSPAVFRAGLSVSG